MSEQSNKPSPDAARAGVPEPKPGSRASVRQGELRAPMTQTRDALETKRRPRASARMPTNAAGSQPAAPAGRRRRSRANARARSAPARENPGQRAPRVQTPLPPITYPEDLPVSGRREEIAKALMENQVIIVSGETGSGKTTQLPKICLQLGRGEKGLIGHTQPRRIAASSTAKRIARRSARRWANTSATRCASTTRCSRAPRSS
jgi:ATP-dependent helicase HrpA